MIWGYALVWPGDILNKDVDPLLARLQFLAPYGMKATGASIPGLSKMDPAVRDSIGDFLAEHDMQLTLHPRVPCFNEDRDEVKKAVEENLKQLEALKGLTRTSLVTLSAGRVHRFMKDPSLNQQMEMLEEALTPLAKGCHQLGVNIGIENHGDYYCSDLASLCEKVPHLGIFLDTGNCYLVGEACLPAFKIAARHTVGSHFKDHHVQPRPDARPLHFEVAPSVIGEGDVPLKECWEILKADCPNFDDLVMEIELIPPSDRPFLESFEQSVSFVKSLS